MIRAARLGCVASSLLIVLLAALRWGGWWRVDEVWISPTRYTIPEKLTGILLGANVLRLQTDGIRAWIERDPRILEVAIRVCPFLKRVEVRIEERKPTVNVRLRNGEEVWVDSEGVILEPASGAHVIGVALVGDRVPAEVIAAARRVGRLDPGLLDRFASFDVSDPSQVVATGTGPSTLRLGEIGQLGHRLAILETLWRQGLLAEFVTADFRVDGEVILKRRR